MQRWIIFIVLAGFIAAALWFLHFPPPDPNDKNGRRGVNFERMLNEVKSAALQKKSSGAAEKSPENRKPAKTRTLQKKQ